MSQLVLADGVRVIDLVAQDDEGDLGQLLHGEEGVELGFGFGKALVVLGVDEEHDAGDLREVVLPETAGWIDTALAGGARLVQSLSYTWTYPVDVHPDQRL